MQFDSHLDMLMKHEMYEYWDEWDINEDDFILMAFDRQGNMIYYYRVCMEE